jgi:hypothetical protein
LPLPKIGINNMLSVNSLYRSSYKDSFDSLYESILNDFDIDNINPLFEVSIDAPRYFKQLEIDLDIFTQKDYNKISQTELNKVTNKLYKTLSKILNVDVGLYIGDFKNCMIYPQYYFIKKKDIKFDKNKKPILEESLLNIKTAYFFIDIELFMYKLKLTPAEMVGILLHEIGHLTYHRNFITNFFGQFLSRFKNVLIISSIFSFIKMTLYAFSPQFIALFLSIIFLFTRTLSFFEHKQEYYCDKFATKYGYGDEIASAFIKLGNYTNTVTKTSRTLFKKIIDFIKTIFNSSTHPGTVNRICTIAEQLKKDYINSYPKIKSTLERDLNRLGC